jgi:F-type H+-transporting ATPase subunit epsilon
MDTFHLRIVTPTRAYIEKDVEVLTTTASSMGELSLYAHHADLIAALDICPLILKANGHIDYYAISGGVLTVTQATNTAVLILNSIESLDEIDLQRAVASKVAAEKLLGEVKTPREAIEMERQIKRAINRINIKNNYKNV